MSYGYCPRCGLEGITRERRPNGNDSCVNGHTYLSRDAITFKESTPPTSEWYEGMIEDLCTAGAGLVTGDGSEDMCRLIEQLGHGHLLDP